MTPVSRHILVLLLLCLCALCQVQWWRESRLREFNTTQSHKLSQLTADLELASERLKTADAEVLRLTAAMAELRSNSVSRESLEEAVQVNARLNSAVETQNERIRALNDALEHQGDAVRKANESIRQIAASRDDLAKRLNEVTALYNRTINEGRAEAKPGARP